MYGWIPPLIHFSGWCSLCYSLLQCVVVCWMCVAVNFSIYGWISFLMHSWIHTFKTLQRTSTTLQYTATHYNTLQPTAMHTATHIPHAATHYYTLQHTATHIQHTFDTPQPAATHCKTLQHIATQVRWPFALPDTSQTATHCNTHSTHCNTLQHNGHNTLQHRCDGLSP